MCNSIAIVLALTLSAGASTEYYNGNICDDCDSVVTIKGADATSAYFNRKNDTSYNKECSWREIPFKSGKENGVQYSFSQDGNVISEVEWNMGENTIISTYSQNAKISSIEYYENNALASATIFKANGLDSIKATFHNDTMYYAITSSMGVDSILDVIVSNNLTYRSEYFSNGQLYKCAPVLNGQWNGAEKEYYESGRLYCETQYKLGKPSGRIKCYYESGKIMQIIDVNNGKWNGKNVEYFENGKMKSSSKYKRNQLIGFKQCYDKSGRPGALGNENLECE